MKKLKAKNAIFTENVGIGTTSPGANLEIKGGSEPLAIYDANDEKKLRVFTAVNGTALALADGGEDIIRLDGRASTPNSSYFNGGNVGIGTTSPSSKLEILDGNNHLNLKVNDRISQSVLKFSDLDGLGAAINYDHNTDRLHFITDGTATPSNGALNIESNGNVGIGTANPIAALNIADVTADTNAFAISRVEDGTIPLLRIFQDSTWQVGGVGQGSGIAHVNTNNRNLAITTSDDGNLTGGLFISHVGRVGIGTTNPDANLQLAGNFKVTKTAIDGGDNALYLNVGGGPDHPTLDIYDKDGNAGARITGNGNSWISAKGGNVGIGTTSPNLAKLEVHGDSAATRVGLLIADASGRASAVHQVGDKLIFNDFTSGATRMVINGLNGNVGIGTTSPIHELDVYGFGKIIGITSTHADTTRITHASLVADANGWGSIYAYSNVGNPIVRLNSNGDSYLNGGNVGIGTTNPYGKLHVQANADAYASFNYASSGFGGTTSDEVSLTYSNKLHFGAINSSNNPQVTMSLLKDGNVGIGTTNPGAYKLSVIGLNQEFVQEISSGNSTNAYGLYIEIIGNHDNKSSEYIRCSTNGNTSINFRVYSDGTMFSNGTSLGSDDRIKHNEEKIVNAVETLSKITPKKYFKTTKLYEANHDFNLDSDGNPIDESGEPVNHRVEAGVIAQEVLGVDELKFAVSPETKDEDGEVTSPHSLDYNSLFTYAIAAIQEQQTMIEDLKKEIEQLKS